VIVELSDLKKQTRKAASDVRKRAHDIAAEDAPLKLASRSLPFAPVAGRSVLSAFYPYQSEIDTRPLLGKLAGEGWTTCLPIVIALGEALEFRRWLPGAPTVPGMWGIPRPPDNATLVEPDVLLVPMLAFDRQGYRLGYGGGFYDRTLQVLRAKKNIIAIGVAYAEQEIASVPHDALDQQLDFILTERELFAP
jgi:5-formyltetrahydrofolate cyclo-ligase